jgi:beta-glucosidase
VTYSQNGDGVDGSFKAAIAVVGETPYAEGAGDRPDGMGLDSADLGVLAKLKASGVPVVVVLVSGRPLDVAAELAGWDALVAAWLPGTEGQGVADVLFGVVRPTGKLPVTWMQSAGQQPINDGDGKPALFPYGYGEDFPTSQNPRNIVGAAYYDGQSGTQLERCTDSGCGQNVGWIAPGDYLYYDDVDFGAASPATVLSRVASGSSTTGTIEYRLDSQTGPVVASVPISNTGGWQSWTSRTVPLSGPATGKHRLYVVFAGPGGDFVNLNWFQFS